MVRSIGIVLFDVVEELDFAGPWEIFTFAGQTDTSTCTVFTVSQHGGEVKCAKGLRVVADYCFKTAPHADILLVPGGMGAMTEVDNACMVKFITDRAQQAELTASVCTGAFLLRKAGLLDGKRATTHWAFIEELRKFPSVTVVEGQRYVDEGAVITSAGISAGIDMALYIVGQLWGPAFARTVQKGTEYFPDPPYSDVPIPPESS